ncbi:MAG: hypothetical protein BGO25_12700 [Acidobacteriales bacterium 59-55]|nr:MAG: hypothetical protein ABT04_01615 [Granulicella sp. SCN 62-9]OJV43986.1 MAG: hypothetical protein BGO25_12700 [Acidobacteriales bacterium 59-55]
MSAIRRFKFFFAGTSIQFFALILFAVGVPAVMAQGASGMHDTASAAMLALPDSPGAVSARADSASSSSTSSSSLDPAPGAQAGMSSHSGKTASPTDSVVLPSEQAPTLTSRDKFVMGVKSVVSPLSVAGWLGSAGWSHLTNGPPNYGTDSGAFGQRLGAAAIRSSSQNFFSTSIMANVLHEDPRYYKLGRSHSIRNRILYAATRPLITRTDSGRRTVNLALLTGNLAGAILTNAYYPQQNHGFSETAKIFGSSIGGSAIGFGVSEFLGDALQLIHLKKAE